jgi:hypothetical protein
VNRDGAGFLASWGSSIHLFIDHTELSVVGHGGSVLRIVPESLMGRSVESASIWVRQYGADKVEAGKRSIDHYRAAKMLGTEVLMTRISFLYPNRKDARFDIDSYVEEHMPLSIALLSAHPCFKRVSVERGVSGVAPGLGPATWQCVTSF